MTGAPRSATVVALEECWAVEFLRNLFDRLCRDPSYRQYVDQLYRRRAMRGHLQRLEILRNAPPEVIDWLERQDELVTLQRVDAGDIIVAEGDPSDAMYIVRSGVVQVVRGLDLQRWVVQEEDITDWRSWCQQLVEEANQQNEPDRTSGTAAPQKADPLAALKQQRKSKSWMEWLGEQGVAEAVERLAGNGAGPDDRRLILQALNRHLPDPEFLKSLPQDLWKVPALQEVIGGFPRGTAGIASHWSQLQRLQAGRWVAHAAFPERIRPPRPPADPSTRPGLSVSR